jgi:hypothetical protein
MGRSERIEVVPGSLGAIKQALNPSGWIDDEVIAAGEAASGKPTTLVGVVTGAAIVELLRPRRSKYLPATSCWRRRRHGSSRSGRRAAAGTATASPLPH